MPAPDWTPAVPRFRLIDAPSPLQRLDRLTAALRDEMGSAAPEMWCKREDLLPVGLGGNKLRNLEFHLGAALAAGATTVVTAGRRWSNHCRLTAAAGAMAGLRVELVLSGPPLDPPGPNEQLAGHYGATVHRCLTDDRAEREARLAAVMSASESAGERPYLIPLGGSGLTGVLGQVAAALECDRQLMAHGVDPAAVVLPTATGGTQAGLLAGFRLAGREVPVIGIAVGAPSRDLGPVAAELARQAAESIAGQEVGEAIGDWDPGPAVVIEDAWIGQGYGRRSTDADAAARLVARTEGIVVDPIYTAKAMAGTLALIARGAIGAGGPVLFWHAGGTLGVLEPLVGEG